MADSGVRAAVALLSGVCFGTAPAWLLARTNPIEVMRGVGRASADSQPHLRKLLVMLQVAASVSLLAGASLLTRSLLNIEGEDFGFIAKNRIVLRMEEPLAAYSHEHLNLLYRELQEGLERLPGVRSASLALYSPFTAHWEQLVVKPGEGMPSIDGSRKVLWDRVSPRYFNTIGQQLLVGREFTEGDMQRRDRSRSSISHSCAGTSQASIRSAEFSASLVLPTARTSKLSALSGMPSTRIPKRRRSPWCLHLLPSIPTTPILP